MVEPQCRQSKKGIDTAREAWRCHASRTVNGSRWLKTKVARGDNETKLGRQAVLRPWSSPRTGWRVWHLFRRHWKLLVRLNTEGLWSSSVLYSTGSSCVMAQLRVFRMYCSTRPSLYKHHIFYFNTTTKQQQTTKQPPPMTNMDQSHLSVFQQVHSLWDFPRIPNVTHMHRVSAASKVMLLLEDKASHS